MARNDAAGNDAAGKPMAQNRAWWQRVRLRLDHRRSSEAMRQGQVHYQQLLAVADSRRAIVAAFEIERRRIERDLHDGAQQHLVATALKVGEATLLLEEVLADSAVGLDTATQNQLQEVFRLLSEAQDAGERSLNTLRNTVTGIHPKVLSDLGLEAAIRDLAAQSPVPVNVRIPYPLPVLPDGVVTTAYFVVAEALTNVAKHVPQARASVVIVVDDMLRISIVDNGPGGAVVRAGGGLAGLQDRLITFGGTLQIASPAGGPTTISATIPLLLRAGESTWERAISVEHLAVESGEQ